MQAELISRLRASPGVTARTGVVPNGGATRPAIDWIERKSDDRAAFPAMTLQTISAPRGYDQDGADGLQIRRIRFENYGLTYEGARLLADAAIAEMEAAAVIGSVRFHRSKVMFDRDFPPEDLGGGLKIFRTLVDISIPSTRT
ncbi:MAG: hypothetical protein VYD90_12825 [Pseudomonadota bacterium]|nr:hypothetical protein [Pseudomonadota bacterium]